jgi:DNA-binding transcriptional LysR family regulator
LIAQSQQDKTELTGSIRISSPIGFSQTMLINSVSQFISEHPRVTIDIHASDSFSDLVEKRIDVALRYTNTPDENLIARPLMKIGSTICASEIYLKKHGHPIVPKDLANHSCLVHLSNNHWQLIKDNKVEEVKVSGPLISNDVTTLVQATINDTGIALLPYDLARLYIANQELVPILTDYTIASNRLWAVYLSRSYQTPVVRAFIDFVAMLWQEDIEPNGSTRGE